MVGGRTELPIPVSCVEANRWSYRSRQFASGGTTSHGILRAKMCRQATRGYQATGTPTSDQHAVWDEVTRKLGMMGSTSPSRALAQAYEDHLQRLDQVLTKVAVPKGCCGAVFVIHGRIAGVDLFDQPATLARLWPKLVRGYAIDALERTADDNGPLSREAVAQWLQTAASAHSRSFKSPGLGDDVRLEADGLVGAGLVVENQPVHVELFAEATGPA
jgi:hypothetical protein